MNILVIGLNHKTASVEMRERLSFTEGVLNEALKQLRSTKGVLESVIISTCNRMELHVVVDQVHRGVQYTKLFLENWFGVPRAEFQDHLYIRQDRDAVEHLFRVVCGLDSMIVGETQILGQVKEAFFLAQRLGNTGTLFNQLFKQAITFGKRVHTETRIGEQAVSTSYAALELIKRVYGSLQDKRVVVIGAGKIAELTLRHLHANGARHIVILNRTLAHAETVAASFQAQARPLDQLPAALKEADIVISSTGASHYILQRQDVEAICAERKGRPLFFMDMAVPRDLDPAIHHLPNTYLYDIDDLEGIVEANLAERMEEAAKIERWIVRELDKFEEWIQMLGVIPLISALREKALDIHQETLTSLQNKLPHLGEREMKVIRKHTMSLLNQMMRDPIQRLKELAPTSRGEQAKDLFAHFFALEERLQLQEDKEAREEISDPKTAYIPVPILPPR